MSQFSTSSTRWAALQSRNPRAASAFVYCVTTTRIYCRPTCPSRLARRANILFLDTAAEAEREGFRACRRCRPELGDGEGDPQKIAVEKACDLIMKEQDGIDARKWSVKALAAEVRLTESNFCRVFKKVMGMTVGEYRAFISPGILEGLPKVFNTDQQQILDVSHESRETISKPDTLDTYGCESSLSLAEFDCPELEEHWHRFPDHSSDPTKVVAMDDGFQFFDFDTLGRTEL